MFFFAGVALTVYGFNRGKKIRLASEEYESAYPLFHTKSVSDKNSDTDENNDIGENEK